MLGVWAPASCCWAGLLPPPRPRSGGVREVSVPRKPTGKKALTPAAHPQSEETSRSSTTVGGRGRAGSGLPLVLPDDPLPVQRPSSTMLAGGQVRGEGAASVGKKKLLVRKGRWGREAGRTSCCEPGWLAAGFDHLPCEGRGRGGLRPSEGPGAELHPPRGAPLRHEPRPGALRGEGGQRLGPGLRGWVLGRLTKNGHGYEKVGRWAGGRPAVLKWWSAGGATDVRQCGRSGYSLIIIYC